MNLALSDEQEFLREAARGTLARVNTVEAAREALEGAPLPDLWPAACEAGWPGLLVSEDHGGAGLGPFDAMLVMGECGRVLAGVPLLGHLPASWLLDRGGHPALQDVAAGTRRAAFVGAQPPSDLGGGWTWDGEHGKGRVPAGDGTTAHWVVDAPGADVFVVVGAGGSVSVVEGVTVETVTRYDATRSLGLADLSADTATPLDVSATDAANAWHLAQALIAAESLGTVETCLELAVAYAKERFTFGRAIGSYQAIKHQLVEVLRVLENGRSLLYYAGWAGESKPEEFALAASAARSVAGRALDTAARTNIAVHGGIGATWEHDAPLYFRRAQLSRRLLGGTGGATDRVAGELIAAAA
ncbi:acyl-CoA dehydrogenase family protein [Capillimicrobium parvum]|uniref:Acyl-CoA dehydrogenase n=1 Tax=Capillimicrobium parvum TaxID=2884022 RepID=A0A9E6XUB1_9ACTN|nr:acyl-CoA dehydrogenase family protein [Capillimicrobium parvum]UGS33922.1 Acyl-CoA dehydrogenase [Capillimicrobium parvum]